MGERHYFEGWGSKKKYCKPGLRDYARRRGGCERRVAFSRMPPIPDGLSFYTSAE